MRVVVVVVRLRMLLLMERLELLLALLAEEDAPCRPTADGVPLAQ
ncbi:MAG TPA: hypothetical protein VF475_10125 [Sphingobium sp.]